MTNQISCFFIHYSCIKPAKRKLILPAGLLPFLSCSIYTRSYRHPGNAVSNMQMLL